MATLLEEIDSFDSDGDEELEEEVVVTFSSKNDELVHEEDFEENVHIPYEKNGEVDPNMESDYFEPSPIVDEMGKPKLESVYIESPIYAIEFE